MPLKNFTPRTLMSIHKTFESSDVHNHQELRI
jgi:hypothetical protein